MHNKKQYESFKTPNRYQIIQRISDANASDYKNIIYSLYCDHATKTKCDHNHAKYDPVPAKHLEIMLFDVIHQEFDDKYGNGKCHHHAKEQHACLNRGKGQTELHDL